MVSFILWYIIVSLTGLAAFPLAYRLLPALPDRGYTFSRALGLLVWGYGFWLLGSLGILGNDLGGQAFALAVLLGLSILALRGGRLKEIRVWLGSQRVFLFIAEALFLLAFAGLAMVRAANPDLTSTEKPMELAFINAILRSPSMPPNDPWLSGYAISYYYFGYLLVAMLARVLGVTGSVAHNLGTALVFGLGATGAYGVVYNLIQTTADRRLPAAEDGRNLLGIETLPASGQPRSAVANRSPLLAFLGPLFILLISNLEGFLEILHARGLFWRLSVSGEMTSGFWKWLDILDLNQPPTGPLGWVPRTFGTGNWWWWRASRVLQDYNFTHAPREIIDEFPFFSFLLADLHPHVIAIPFALLAMGLALNLYLGGGCGRINLPGQFHWELSKSSFLLAAVALGSIFFFNASDFPFYVALVAGAYALGRIKDGLHYTNQETVDPQPSDLRSPAFQLLFDFASLGVALGAAGYLLYLPFHLSFSSQVSGINPSLVYFTRGAYLWVMFAPLLLPVGAFLLHLWRTHGGSQGLKRGLLAALGILVGLWALSLLFGGLQVFVGNLLQASGGSSLLQEFGAPDWPSLLRESILRRLAAPGGWITLTLLLAGTLGLVLGSRGAREQGSAGDTNPYLTPSHPGTPALFVLLLILLGALLVLGADFFYLRDQFGSRFNTIFKFYYTAWMLWGIAAAYSSAFLLSALRGAWGTVFRAGLVALIGAGLVYAYFGLREKTNNFNPPDGWTLDGGAYLARWAPEDLAAIRWLQTAPAGVIVEAVHPQGGQYTEFARISTYSGLPTVLGWVGHESQWRGSDESFRGRQADIELFYTTRDWNQAQAILHKYGIRYVILGQRERSVYRVSETKFEHSLTPVFRQGSLVIYEVP